MATAVRKTNRPFPQCASVSKHLEMRTRLWWTIPYKSLYLVHPSLELVTLLKGAISIVSNNPYEVLVSKGAAGKLVNKSQGQKGS